MTADIVSAARQTSYSAFLSYVHEDSETAGWLHGLLSRYWVPGRRRRRIYHDREQITATSLTEQIERALRQASFLIVCWSENAARSTWVPREIAFFLKAHPQAVAEDRVLICRTGPAPAAGDDPIPELPAGLRALAARTVFFPDLRGAPAQARGRARRPYLEAALSLLAPLVGLGDREKVLRLRLRRQIQVLAVVMAALLAAAASWWAWQRWLKTPEGLLHQNVARALAGARTEDIADTRLFATARAIGRLNRNDLLEPLSTMLPPDQLRDLFLASGYVSFPHPDCRAAARALGKLDSSSAHAWPEPLILVARICGGNWVERALPEPREPRQVADQARLLARYGYTLRALELARRADFPAPDRLSLRVAFALGRGPALAVLAPASEVSRWLANETNRYDQLSAALGAGHAPARRNGARAMDFLQREAPRRGCGWMGLARPRLPSHPRAQPRRRLLRCRGKERREADSGEPKLERMGRPPGHLRRSWRLDTDLPRRRGPARGESAAAPALPCSRALGRSQGRRDPPRLRHLLRRCP